MTISTTWFAEKCTFALHPYTSNLTIHSPGLATTMSFQRPVVALAAIGNLGKYIWEELIADGRFDIVVLTRQVCMAMSCHVGDPFSFSKE